MERILTIEIRDDADDKFIQITDRHRIIFSASTRYLTKNELWDLLNKILKAEILSE